MGVYAEVRNFVLAHRACAGPRPATAGAPTVAGGYSSGVAAGLNSNAG
jgi:hypothetical protein